MVKTLALKCNKFEYPLVKEETFIGRAEDSDIRLCQAYISRKHCVIFKGKDGYLIQDLGSRNGTYVDGENIARRACSLKPGDFVFIGSNEQLFYVVEHEEKS